MYQVFSPNSRSDPCSRVFDLTGAYPASDLLWAVARFFGGFCERERPVESGSANFTERRYQAPHQRSGVYLDTQLFTGCGKAPLPPVEGGVFVSDLISRGTGKSRLPGRFICHLHDALSVLLLRHRRSRRNRYRFRLHQALRQPLGTSRPYQLDARFSPIAGNSLATACCFLPQAGRCLCVPRLPHRKGPELRIFRSHMRRSFRCQARWSAVHSFSTKRQKHAGRCNDVARRVGDVTETVLWCRRRCKTSRRRCSEASGGVGSVISAVKTTRVFAGNTQVLESDWRAATHLTSTVGRPAVCFALEGSPSEESQIIAPALQRLAFVRSIAAQSN